MTMRAAEIENNLLAAIPGKEFQRLQAMCEPVTLRLGEQIYKTDGRIRHVYFPGTSLLSLMAQADDQLAVEVGLVGREGMLGVPLILGHRISSISATVQVTGSAIRIAADPFCEEFRNSTALQRVLYLYTNTLMAQISRTAACNRFHMLEQRLARWLLMTHDRVMSDHFRITHEFLSHVLGVRRVGVTKAAQILQMRHLISYSRGDIQVLDRPGLEATACQCYGTMGIIDKTPNRPSARRGPGVEMSARL